VKLKIVFPKSLSAEEERLYQSLKALAANENVKEKIDA
jgi:curved DNA-binding protein